MNQESQSTSEDKLFPALALAGSALALLAAPKSFKTKIFSQLRMATDTFFEIMPKPSQSTFGSSGAFAQKSEVTIPKVDFSRLGDNELFIGYMQGKFSFNLANFNRLKKETPEVMFIERVLNTSIETRELAEKCLTKLALNVYGITNTRWAQSAFKVLERAIDKGLTVDENLSRSLIDHSSPNKRVLGFKLLSLSWFRTSVTPEKLRDFSTILKDKTFSEQRDRILFHSFAHHPDVPFDTLKLFFEPRIFAKEVIASARIATPVILAWANDQTKKDKIISYLTGKLSNSDSLHRDTKEFYLRTLDLLGDKRHKGFFLESLVNPKKANSSYNDYATTSYRRLNSMLPAHIWDDVFESAVEGKLENSKVGLSLLESYKNRERPSETFPEILSKAFESMDSKEFFQTKLTILKIFASRDSDNLFKNNIFYTLFLKGLKVGDPVCIVHVKELLENLSRFYADLIHADSEVKRKVCIDILSNLGEKSLNLLSISFKSN